MQSSSPSKDVFISSRFGGQTRTATELAQRLRSGEAPILVLRAIGRRAIDNARQIARKVKRQLEQGPKSGSAFAGRGGEAEDGAPLVALELAEHKETVARAATTNDDDDDNQRATAMEAIRIELSLAAGAQQKVSTTSARAASSTNGAKKAKLSAVASAATPPALDQEDAESQNSDVECCPPAEALGTRSTVATSTAQNSGFDSQLPFPVVCRPVDAFIHADRSDQSPWPALRVFVPRSSFGFVTFPALRGALKRALALDHLDPCDIMLWNEGGRRSPCASDVIPAAVYYDISAAALAKRKSPKPESVQRPMVAALWLAMGMGLSQRMPRVIPPLAAMCHGLLYRTIDVAICFQHFWSTNLGSIGVVRTLRTGGYLGLGTVSKTEVCEARRDARIRVASENSRDLLSPYLLPPPQNPDEADFDVSFGEGSWPIDHVNISRIEGGGQNRRIALPARSLGLYPKRKKNNRSHPLDGKKRDRIKRCHAVILSADEEQEFGYDTYDDFSDLDDEDALVA